MHLLQTTACNIIVERTHLTRGDLLKVTSRTYILSPHVHFIVPPAPRIFEVKPAISTEAGSAVLLVIVFMSKKGKGESDDWNEVCFLKFASGLLLYFTGN